MFAAFHLVLAQVTEGDFLTLLHDGWTLVLSHNWWGVASLILIAVCWSAKLLLAKRWPWFGQPLVTAGILTVTAFAWAFLAKATGAGFVFTGATLFAAAKVALAGTAGKELIDKIKNVLLARMGVPPKADVQLIQIAAEKKGVDAAELVQPVNPEDAIRRAPAAPTSSL